MTDVTRKSNLFKLDDKKIFFFQKRQYQLSNNIH